MRARSGRAVPQSAGQGALVLSHRGSAGSPGDHLAFAGWHEAEDVLCATGWADLLPLEIHAHQPGLRLRRLAGRTLRRLAGPRALLPPGPPVDRRFDRRRSRPVEHVFFIAQTPFDLPMLERLRLVRRRTGVLSVWLPEIWPTVFDDPKIWHEPFSLADQLFVGHPSVVEPTRRLAPRAQVSVLPVAADVVRFAAPEPLGRRRIDVLGIGRRHPGQHERLLDWAAKNQRLYLYDTLTPRAPAWPQHRAAMANWYHHSSVALCNYAKHDEPEVIGPLHTVPMRLFEGLAAGTLLVGLPPDEADQRELVGEVVVEPFSDPDGRLSPLFEADPDDPAIAARRCRHMALACRRHDWGHRWRTILETLDLPVPGPLEARLHLLSQRADALDALARSLIPRPSPADQPA